MNRIDRELIAAAGENNQAEVRSLLRARADVNAKDNHGWTPLHWACFKRYVHVVKELREHEANTEVKDNDGDTQKTI
jgi:ankyrin repeat protein